MFRGIPADCCEGVQYTTCSYYSFDISPYPSTAAIYPLRLLRRYFVSVRASTFYTNYHAQRLVAFKKNMIIIITRTLFGWVSCDDGAKCSIFFFVFLHSFVISTRIINHIEYISLEGILTPAVYLTWPRGCLKFSSRTRVYLLHNHTYTKITYYHIILLNVIVSRWKKFKKQRIQFYFNNSKRKKQNV